MAWRRLAALAGTTKESRADGDDGHDDANHEDNDADNNDWQFHAEPSTSSEALGPNSKTRSVCLSDANIAQGARALSPDATSSFRRDAAPSVEASASRPLTAGTRKSLTC